MTQEQWEQLVSMSQGAGPNYVSPYAAVEPRRRARDVDTRGVHLLGQSGMASNAAQTLRQRMRRLNQY